MKKKSDKLVNSGDAECLIDHLDNAAVTNETAHDFFIFNLVLLLFDLGSVLFATKDSNRLFIKGQQAVWYERMTYVQPF